MNHVVFVSGGKASFELLRRVIERYSKKRVVALFADTKSEHPDLYRFLDDVERVLDVEIIRLADGRNVVDVFWCVGFLGNSRVDPCSRILKRELLLRYIQDHYPPEDTLLHLGLDWQEEHRIKRVRENYAKEGYQTEFILADPPHMWGDHYIDSIRALGIKPPLLYLLGFEHNNCWGACVKAGQSQWAHLLYAFPDRYAYYEQFEQQFRKKHGNVSILRDWKNGGRDEFKPLTLKEFRERLESGEQIDMFAPASCTCFGTAT